MIEESLVEHLSENVSLVGSRIFALKIPQETQMPCLVYLKVAGGSRDYVMEGQDSLVRGHFQIDCWSDTYGSAKAVAEEVRIALSGFKGTMGTDHQTEVQAAFVEDDIDDNDSILNRVIMSVSIFYEE